jgi:hypothetical protein
LDPSAVSRLLNGVRRVRSDEIAALAAFLDVPPDHLLERLSGPLPGRAAGRRGQGRSGDAGRPRGLYNQGEHQPMPLGEHVTAPADDALEILPFPRSQSVSRLPDLPIFGVAVGGDEGFFEMNGRPIDYTRRPMQLEHVTDGYAVYVNGSSMEPRYFPGELVYVHPLRPVTARCFVVVQLRPSDAGAAPRGFVKQFLRRSRDRLVLHQFNPEKDIEIDAADIIHVHRIIISGEGSAF